MFLGEMERFLSRRGISRIFLQTDRDMPAFAFYKHRGFQEMEGHVSFVKRIQGTDITKTVDCIISLWRVRSPHGRSLNASIGHFHDKLLRLKDEMNTDTGLEIAQARHQYMVDFLAEYKHETAAME